MQKSMLERVNDIKKQAASTENSDISITERAKDSIRGALRVLDMIKDIPEAKSLPPVTDIFETVNKTDILKSMYAAFSSEKTV